MSVKTKDLQIEEDEERNKNQYLIKQLFCNALAVKMSE